jgi:hypothetical protein
MSIYRVKFWNGSEQDELEVNAASTEEAKADAEAQIGPFGAIHSIIPERTGTEWSDE